MDSKVNYYKNGWYNYFKAVKLKSSIWTEWCTMKFLSIIVYVFVMLSLVSKLEARQRFYCLWSTKRACSRTTPTCLRLQSGIGAQNSAVYTCKYYRNDCQYLLDNCKGSTCESLLTSLYCYFIYINEIEVLIAE